MIKLFKITLIAYKTFHVEARDQEDALQHAACADEADSTFGDLKWQHDETTARECSPAEEEFVRKHAAKGRETIFKQDDDEDDDEDTA